MHHYTLPVLKTQTTKKKRSDSGNQYMASTSLPLLESQCENLWLTPSTSNPLSLILTVYSISISQHALSQISLSLVTSNSELLEMTSYMPWLLGSTLALNLVINPFGSVLVLMPNTRIGNKSCFTFRNQLS
jgi:hypothetical protein